MQTGVLRVLNSTGDQQVSWDLEAALEGDVEAAKAVEEARRIFDEQRRKGHTAFQVGANQQFTRLDSFDPSVSETLLVPRVVGG